MLSKFTAWAGLSWLVSLTALSFHAGWSRSKWSMNKRRRVAGQRLPVDSLPKNCRLDVSPTSLHAPGGQYDRKGAVAVSLSRWRFMASCNRCHEERQAGLSRSDNGSEFASSDLEGLCRRHPAASSQAHHYSAGLLSDKRVRLLPIHAFLFTVNGSSTTMTHIPDRAVSF